MLCIKKFNKKDWSNLLKADCLIFEFSKFGIFPWNSHGLE